MKIHFCLIDKECRKWGAPCYRIHISTKKWNLGIALRPRDKFARWCPKTGDKCSWSYYRLVSNPE